LGAIVQRFNGEGSSTEIFISPIELAHMFCFSGIPEIELDDAGK
jgi:hypothetical protein